jgi:hypothetical protein
LYQLRAHLPRGDPVAALRNGALLERLPHHAVDAKRQGLTDDADPKVGSESSGWIWACSPQWDFASARIFAAKGWAPVGNKNEPNPSIAKKFRGSSARSSSNSRTAARACRGFLHRPHPECIPMRKRSPDTNENVSVGCRVAQPAGSFVPLSAFGRS